MYRDYQTHCSCNPHTNTHCIQCPHLRKLYLFYSQIHPVAIPTTVFVCDVFSQIQRRRHLVMIIWIAIRIPLRLDIHSIFWSISLVRIVIKIIPRPAGGWQTWTWQYWSKAEILEWYLNSPLPSAAKKMTDLKNRKYQIFISESGLEMWKVFKASSITNELGLIVTLLA